MHWCWWQKSIAYFESAVCAWVLLRVCLFYTVLCVFVSARANARSCLCTRGYMAVIALPLIYVCIGLGCVILLREIISSNVHWPDSLPVLCSFRCINILKESPGETESLCKHNRHESAALCTLGLINRMKMDKICTHSMLIHLRRGDLLCLALLDQAFTIAFALLCYLQIFTAHVWNILWL